jgi:hypothetical protein
MARKTSIGRWVSIPVRYWLNRSMALRRSSSLPCVLFYLLDNALRYCGPFAHVRSQFLKPSHKQEVGDW